MKNNSLYTEISNYAASLQKRIALLQSKFDRSPAGDLKPFKIRGQTYYCIRGPRPERALQYLPAGDPRLVRYANKYYMKKVLPVLRKNLEAAEMFLQIHSGMEEADAAAAIPPLILGLNENLYLPPERRAQQWAEEPYVRNPYHEEGLIHDTVQGDKVRSKSEAMIANALFAHGLVYRIEPPLDLGSRTVYPDFAVLETMPGSDAGCRNDTGTAGDPSRCGVLYWEHFGMMNDPDYAQQACRKLRDYAEFGLFPGRGLICTFESEAAPLTSSRIEACIRQYFER